MEKMAEPLPNSAAHRCEQSKHCGLPVETSSKTQEVNINSRHNVAHLSAGVSSQVEEHEPKGAGKVDIKCLDKDGIKEVSHDKQKEGAEEEIVIEQPLFTIKEVFVYRVPPLRASSGHRAEEWGLANPVFTGKRSDSKSKFLVFHYCPDLDSVLLAVAVTYWHACIVSMITPGTKHEFHVGLHGDADVEMWDLAMRGEARTRQWQSIYDVESQEVCLGFST